MNLVRSRRVRTGRTVSFPPVRDCSLATLDTGVNLAQTKIKASAAPWRRLRLGRERGPAPGPTGPSILHRAAYRGLIQDACGETAPPTQPQWSSAPDRPSRAVPAPPPARLPAMPETRATPDVFEKARTHDRIAILEAA